MKNSYLVASMLILSMAMFSACTKNSSETANSSNNTSVTNGAATAPQNSGFDSLSRVFTTGDMGLDGYIDDCSIEDALANLDLPVDPTSADEIEQLWNDCQSVYACSPTTVELLNMLFEGEEDTIKIGFADLKAMNLPHMGNSTHGIFIPGTNKIILDLSQNTPIAACDSILNQVLHRFDDEKFGGSGDSALESEYEAHWYQAAFLDEISMLSNNLGKAYLPLYFRGANDMYISNIELHDELVKGFKFSPNPGIVENYTKLPREESYGN